MLVNQSRTAQDELCSDTDDRKHFLWWLSVELTYSLNALPDECQHA